MNMFRSATFTLTLYYVLIIAVISFCFSGALYGIASGDLAASLNHQTKRLSDDFPVFSGSPYLQAGNELRVGRQHLIARLAIFNAIVVVGGGFASYALARRTLRPIELAHQRQVQFTADVSHELRTPLTALQMESEVALLDPKIKAPELRAILASNVEESKKLTGLVANLLRLSQLDTDSKTVPLAAIPLQEVTSPAISQVRPAADSVDITVANDITEQLLIRSDESIATQLLVILLDNAVKYSPPGSQVTVAAARQHEHVIVSVTDHGQGIAAADLEHIFERFYRADSSRSSTATIGYGLGLSIAKQLAEQVAATIEISSQAGSGTTARVYFPSQAATANPATGRPTS